ncbi:hypothetical protein FRC12_013406 [Ceratobasidium sp. 428]|nr:hypothetical protein FRC12_013406 [Ceratobasidium sp. 428]
MDLDPDQCLALVKRAFYDYHHSDIDPIPCLDCARLASEFAAQHAPSASVRLTALISWSRAYMFLADADTSSCVEHAQNSVATAERAVSFFSETSPSDLVAKARVYDQLGCALRQRYVYLAN